MKTTTTTSDKPEPPASIELWDAQTVLRFFGGIHISTLYRHLGTIYPRPVNIAGSSVRWIASECRDALNRMIAARPEQQSPKPQPPKKPRGRPRRRIEP